MCWTDERVDTLKKLWLDGLSASLIAKQLGGITRNAVIGKVHRLGLAGRAQPSHPAAPKFKPPRPRAPRPMPASRPRAVTAGQHVDRPIGPRYVEVAVRAVPFAELPGTETILTLGAHMCKWPIGDPLSDGFTFCGRRSEEETPYYVDHARMAYAPPASKRKTTVAELTRSLRRYL